MDIREREELKKFFLSWVAALQSAETEACVYRHVAEVLRTISPDLVKQVETAARLKVSESLDTKYAQYRKSVTESVEKGYVDQALLQYLSDWKPEGPTN
jgi:hypothetical protein